MTRQGGCGRKFAALTAMCLVVAGSSIVGGSAGAAPRGAALRLVDRDCGALPAVDIRVSCHWLSVPENRDSRGTKTIRLAVAVLHSRSAQAEPDPVVFLSGGPGGAGIEGLENFATSPMLENRDLVLFDQRGTGVSEPSLDCPEREEFTLRDLARAEPYKVELVAQREATMACRSRLEQEGIDLDAYDTEENAGDVADLRKSLGVDEWNLYGVSYGTRLALATMRAHPQGIRSAVLDSVYPPDVRGLVRPLVGADEAFDRLFSACEADDVCRATHPDLRQTFRTLVDRFNAVPAKFTLDVGDPSGEIPFVVTGDQILAALFNAMYDTNLIPLLPSAIEDLATGDTSAIRPLAQAGIRVLNAPAEGVFLSMECADAARFAGSRHDAKVVADPGDKAVLVRFSAAPYCEGWDVEPLPDSFSRAVRSRIPTLVLAGSLDPITPPSDSKRAAKTLRNAQYVEFAGFGHETTKGTDCPRAIRQDFLDDPGARLDTSCADELRVVFA